MFKFGGGMSSTWTLPILMQSGSIVLIPVLVTPKKEQISSKTSTSMTLTGSVGTEIILTVIDSTTLSISGTADGYVVAGTLKPVSIVKC